MNYQNRSHLDKIHNFWARELIEVAFFSEKWEKHDKTICEVEYSMVWRHGRKKSLINSGMIDHTAWFSERSSYRNPHDNKTKHGSPMIFYCPFAGCFKLSNDSLSGFLRLQTSRWVLRLQRSQKSVILGVSSVCLMLRWFFELGR